MTAGSGAVTAHTGTGAGSADAGGRDAALAQRQVALLVASPADFAVGMFGAWAAGLGVLPLPADSPDARLRDMLTDCRPRLLLACAALWPRAERLAQGLRPPIRTLALEAIAGESAPAADRPLTGPPEMPGCAYTVYTSGSTGRPKGVLIRRDQVSRLVAWSGHAWALGPWVRMAQTLSLGFDFGLQEVFTTLPHGGCLVVPSARDRASAREYARFLRRERVNVLFTTPSYADQLIAAGEVLPDLRHVLLGGEVLRGSTVAGLRGLVPAGCRLVNGYGPTEATVNCLAYEIPPALRDDELPDVLPVGSASAAAVIHLVDDRDRPVPVGAVGQILIGGPGVAAGYLHQPRRSAGRFIPDPYGTEPGALAYRSGDLAYVDRAGGFVVLGRDDRQVKLRGHRVELGEVEYGLRGAPGVHTAVARVMDDPRRLVAFVCGADVDVPELLDHLARHLPPAMMPHQVVALDQLPVTPNGKLDESRLREFAQEQYIPVLPRTATTPEVRSAVCQVWAKALGVAQVAAETNVFEVGAHSLVVTAVHVQLQIALGLTFPVHLLFEHPCPGDLADLLAAQRSHREPAPPTESLTTNTVRGDP